MNRKALEELIEERIKQGDPAAAREIIIHLNSVIQNAERYMRREALDIVKTTKPRLFGATTKHEIINRLEEELWR